MFQRNVKTGWWLLVGYVNAHLVDSSADADVAAAAAADDDDADVSDEDDELIIIADAVAEAWRHLMSSLQATPLLTCTAAVHIPAPAPILLPVRRDGYCHVTGSEVRERIERDVWTHGEVSAANRDYVRAVISRGRLRMERWRDVE